MLKIVSIIILLFLFSSGNAIAGEWQVRGDVAVETRIFPRNPKFSAQDDTHLSPSFKLEPEFIYETSDFKHRFTLKPFFRFDFHDNDRTHFDARELHWTFFQNKWILLVGVSKVFWGVAESRHLVDIINQTDAVEDIDGEDKLGQPMVHLTYETDFGAFSFFYLPFFRERTFPDDEARLRGPVPIENDADYESGADEWHQDFALRWERTISEFDIGAAFFYGTSREPRFRFTPLGNLRPVYDIIDQESLDIQWTHDALLVKFEGILRGGAGDRFIATVTGFEYTLYQILNSNADLGLLSEFHYDERDTTAPPTIFQQDLFAGMRLALNDVKDTEVLGGFTFDLEGNEISTLLEAKRRIGERYLLEFELRWILTSVTGSIADGIIRDSFSTVSVSRFF